MVFVFCTASNVDWYLHKVSWRYHEKFSIYRAGTICDGQSSKGNN